MRKGIVLAGGSGSRLYPLTASISKQLLPVYDKPMIYYPLSVLMLAGIREILIISTPQDTPRFEQMLRDGSRWGIKLSYAVQEKPEGLAQAFIIAEEFLQGNSCAMVLGDNIFYGNELSHLLKEASSQDSGATVFAYKVKDSERYGVIDFDKDGKASSIVEKPQNPASKFAVTGLYFYDNRVVDFAKKLKPSVRAEIEITDINQRYLDMGELKVQVLSRGMAWLDTGTFESLLDASVFIEMIQQRQGVKISCLEEIAYRKGFIDAQQVKTIASDMVDNSYKEYLLEILDEPKFTRNDE